MLQIIGIKNCNTIRKTLSWLDENGTEYEFRDVKKDPLSEEELSYLIERVGLETLVNKRGMKWRSLGLSDKKLSDNELADLLMEHQVMIKRPVVAAESAVIVGFDEEALEGFIEEYA